jgi:Kef-type K+ transport system membrane component KefB
VRPLLTAIVRRGRGSSQLPVEVFVLILVVLIGACWFTEVIGLSALIGAFQVGLLIPRESALTHALVEKLETFTVTILMPLYFTTAGLKTQFGLIADGETAGLAILVIVVATVSKFLGIAVPC